MKATTKKAVPAGGNRTGTAIAPDRTSAMVSGNDEFGPTSSGSREDLLAAHAEVALAADPVGSLPPMKDGELDPEDPAHAVLLDKLGERLAFERTGTRLYDGIIGKHEAYGSFSGGPDRDELEEHRAEERSHFEMLRQVILELGGDPTAVTPGADVAGVASRGIADVIHDPRTNLKQSLEALMIAELTDAASWEMLIKLADAAGQSDLVPMFEKALEREEEHLGNVKRWLDAAHS